MEVRGQRIILLRSVMPRMTLWILEIDCRSYMEVRGQRIILLRSVMPRMTLWILEIDPVPHS